MARRGRATRSCSRTWRARVTWSWPTTPSDRESALSTRQPRPGQSAIGGGGTGEHEYAGRRLILLGANFGLFRAWDGIRGIDYLLTRAEVDPERIGCCGQSGGGTLTQFLAALDSRIRAAVVSEGNTENLAQAAVEPPGSADDAEQNIVPALSHGIDRADLLYAFAPKPLLVTVR